MGIAGHFENRRQDQERPDLFESWWNGNDDSVTFEHVQDKVNPVEFESWWASIGSGEKEFIANIRTTLSEIDVFGYRKDPAELSVKVRESADGLRKALHMDSAPHGPFVVPDPDFFRNPERFQEIRRSLDTEIGVVGKTDLADLSSFRDVEQATRRMLEYSWMYDEYLRLKDIERAKTDYLDALSEIRVAEAKRSAAKTVLTRYGADIPESGENG